MAAFTRERILLLHQAMLDTAGESPFDWAVDRLDAAAPDGIERNMMRVRTAGYIERGRDALRAHRTQVDPDGRWFAVPTSLVEEVYPWEDFEIIEAFVPVPEGSEDFFAGVA